MDLDLIEVVRVSEEAMNVCVRGIVKACDAPIKSLARPEACGVFWQHTIKEHLTSQVMGF